MYIEYKGSRVNLELIEEYIKKDLRSQNFFFIKFDSGSSIISWDFASEKERDSIIEQIDMITKPKILS